MLTELGVSHAEAVPIGEGQREIGYPITKGHAGNGYAAETVAAFLPCILRHLGIDRVYTVCDAENTASCRARKSSGSAQWPRAGRPNMSGRRMSGGLSIAF